MDQQMNLFRVESAELPVDSPAIRPEPEPEPVQTLDQVVRDFLDKCKVKSVLSCRFCHCTEENPCRLASSDDCSLNHKTRCCSKESCRAQLERMERYAQAG